MTGIHYQKKSLVFDTQKEARAAENDDHPPVPYH